MKLFIYTPDKGNTFLLNCCRSSIVCLDGCFVIIIIVVGGTPAEFYLAQKGGRLTSLIGSSFCVIFLFPADYERWRFES